MGEWSRIGLAEGGPWLFVLVAWLVHPHTDSIIISDFPVLSVPHHFWHAIHRVASPDQVRKAAHLCAPFLTSESLRIQCSVLRPQCQVLHGVSLRSTVKVTPSWYIGPFFDGVVKFTSPENSAIGEIHLLSHHHKCIILWPWPSLLHLWVTPFSNPHSPHHLV